MSRLPLSLSLALLLPTASARAESSAPCHVDVVVAPEDVRRVIEMWVRREPVCRTSIEVRVEPTNRGLHLIAEEPSGRRYERVVPNAEAAGVLVASWVASDSLSPVPTTPPVAIAGPDPLPAAVAIAPISPPAPPPAPKPPAPQAIAPAADSPAATKAIPLVALRHVSEDEPAVVRPTLKPLYWGLGIAGVSSIETRMRLRGDVELARASVASLGFILGVGHGDMLRYSYETSGSFIDVRALLAPALAVNLGRARLRAQSAIGLLWTHRFQNNNDYSFSSSRDWLAFPIELSLLLGLRLNDEWSVSAGPIVTWYWGEQEISNGTYTETEFFNDAGVLVELRRAL